MRSRSGTARQESGPIGSACRERYQSAISSERLCIFRHSQTLLPYPPVFNCDLERSDNGGAAVFMRCGQTHQERKDLLRQVLRNFIVRLQFLSDCGADGAVAKARERRRPRWSLGRFAAFLAGRYRRAQYPAFGVVDRDLLALQRHDGHDRLAGATAVDRGAPLLLSLMAGCGPCPA
jgi:hypothetical protein